MLAGREDDAQTQARVAEMVFAAPDSHERDGLMALMYHEGIGVPVDLDMCFALAEKAAFAGRQGLGYFLLGYMCDNAETPDQAEGGPRQKYDHYDAERFYEQCAGIDSRWTEAARLWLGDYFMDMARGGDPDEAVEHYEAVADRSAEAAGRLSDHYWELIMPEYIDDGEWTAQLFRWTSVAARLDPDGYSYRMGWIYADGLGCEPDSDKAVDFFTEAYTRGDWRGADAVAKMLEEHLESDADMTEADRAECTRQIAQWHERAEKMRQEELTDISADPENPLEED